MRTGVIPGSGRETGGRSDRSIMKNRSPLPDRFSGPDLKTPLLREEIENVFGGVRFLEPMPSLSVRFEMS